MAYHLLFNMQRQRRVRVFRPRVDNMIRDLDDVDIVNRYRLDRASIDELIRGYMASEWAVKANRSCAVSESVQVDII